MPISIPFLITLGIGTCNPIGLECPDVVTRLALTVPLYESGPYTINFMLDHSSDIRTRDDRGREKAMIEISRKFTLRF